MSNLDKIEQPFLLTNAIKNNEEAVLRSLYADHYLLVERHVLKNRGNTNHAKDIYQEAFVAMWRNVHLNRFSPKDSSEVRRYLLTIAKYKWLDYLKSSYAKKTVQLQDLDTNILPHESDDDSKIRLVSQKFRLLGNKCRELLGRFYYHKESLSSIAVTFKWTEATAKNNKYRCMEHLKKMIKTERYE